ncbi:type IV pilus biogenesis/stability protein PilW [Methylomonas sp. SURF-2]|uniref:Type IV pilus biogenesis/stability protein PilW n=1 Tax=Methylomonas subterranea TaxID=2952225 RepID=A0ABT1TH33_9GAMM|nr:type IV pilus biogenesis/stability protein PilW [Methylomonas sp. SURF-2]MCQ8104771.1 type IV pilus biogenesis/stability protein PilW [Methylomonas sp. SURF-2]
MPFSLGSRVAGIAAASIVIGACGLLPNFGGDGMSDREKANLNLQMGVRYMELNMLDVAREKLDIAYDLDSGNAEILNALAVFYERIKDDERAEDYYQTAKGKDPDNYSIKNNYGRFLCERGKYEKGMAMLREALDSAMNQRPWQTLSNLGVCLVQQNDTANGEEYLRRALQANPEYPPALQEMLKISYNNQQYMSARAFLERYLAIAKHSPETLWYGFQTERALGNQQAAENYKEQLIVTFPTSPEAVKVKTAISK